MVIAFTAVVSVYKYIDLSDMAATAFSSLETVFLNLTDSINIIFIYLPLYLFIISGIVTTDNFGANGIIKYGSRGGWLISKLILLILNTAAFFILLFGMNMLAAHRVFPFSSSWSSGFISLRVMMGQSALDFVYPPLTTLGISVLALFLLYLLCGAVSVLTAVLTEKEELALLASLLFGISAGLINMSVTANDAFANTVRCIIIVITISIIALLCFIKVKSKDFA